MFGPNHILVTWRWDEGRSPGHENENVFWLFKLIQIITGSVKIITVSWEILEIEFKFSKLCLRVSEPTKRFFTQTTAYT